MLVNLLGGIHKISCSGCNSQIAVFIEKVVQLLCDHPTQKSVVGITLTHGHVRSVPGQHATSFAPNVPQQHWDHTNLYKVITAGGPSIRISTTVSMSQSIRQARPWRIIKNPLALLHYTQNTLYSLHHIQAICKRCSSHYCTSLDTEICWIHTAKEVNCILKVKIT